jgi:hypothetical protein
MWARALGTVIELIEDDHSTLFFPDGPVFVAGIGWRLASITGMPLNFYSSLSRESILRFDSGFFTFTVDGFLCLL